MIVGYKYFLHVDMLIYATCTHHVWLHPVVLVIKRLFKEQFTMDLASLLVFCDAFENDSLCRF